MNILLTLRTTALALFMCSNIAYGGNFTMGGYDREASHSIPSSSEAGLSKKAIVEKGLEVKWHAPTPDGWVATPPLVHGDLVYVGSTNLTSGSMYAFDADTGATKWVVPMPNRGVTAPPLIADNAIYVLEAGGTLHKLNKKTGQEIWSVPQPAILPPGLRFLCFAGLLKVNDSIIMTLNPQDENLGVPHQGVSALISINAKTGEQEWFFLPQQVPDVQTVSLTTAVGNLKAFGAGIWASQPSYSPSLNLIFITTGQTSGLALGGEARGGQSMFAIDASTGRRVWQTQVRPANPLDRTNLLISDVWTFEVPFYPGAPGDTDFGDGPALFKIHGKEYLAGGTKRGFFYVMDAEYGTILNEGAADPIFRTALDLFAELGISTPSVVGPSTTGGVNLDSGYIQKGDSVIHFGTLLDSSDSLVNVAAGNFPFDGSVPSGVPGVPKAPVGTCYISGQGLSPGCPPYDRSHLFLTDAMGSKVVGSYVEEGAILLGPVYMDDMIFVYKSDAAPAANSVQVIDVSDPTNPVLIQSVPLTFGGVTGISVNGAPVTIGNGLIYAGNGFLSGFAPGQIPQRGVFAIGLKDK